MAQKFGPLTPMLDSRMRFLASDFGPRNGYFIHLDNESQYGRSLSLPHSAFQMNGECI